MSARFVCGSNFTYWNLRWVFQINSCKKYLRCITNRDPEKDNVWPLSPDLGWRGRNHCHLCLTRWPDLSRLSQGTNVFHRSFTILHVLPNRHVVWQTRNFRLWSTSPRSSPVCNPVPAPRSTLSLRQLYFSLLFEQLGFCLLDCFPGWDLTSIIFLHVVD